MIVLLPGLQTGGGIMRLTARSGVLNERRLVTMNSEILIVEDEPITQRMIAANLERTGYRVRCAGSIAEAEAAIGASLPDLVLLDWVLPDATGVGLVRRLRADLRTREIPIIMLTSRARESDLLAGIEIGADDYMRNPAMRRISAGGRTIDLGAIEFRMLHFFATHPGRIFSREKLLDKLWGDQVYVQDRTVDAHIRALRQALRPSGLDGLIETVRGSGYCFRHEQYAPT
jgi:two-component system phosphate regulon response regulator PhoB